MSLTSVILILSLQVLHNVRMAYKEQSEVIEVAETLSQKFDLFEEEVGYNIFFILISALFVC